MDYFASVVKNYRPQRYSGSLTLFSVMQVQWFDHFLWKYYVKKNFNIIYVKGKHSDIVKPEYVGGLSSKLKKSLEEFDQRIIERSE